MLSQRWRPVLVMGVAVCAIWIVAVVGYRIARNAKVTAEKVKTYAESVQLTKLSGTERAKAIEQLERMLNSLSVAERQKARFEQAARGWFDEMTEQEKAGFLESTMPTGLKQTLVAFEQLPEDKRRKTVEDALRRLKQERDQFAADQGGGNPGDPNAPPVLSPELQAKVKSIGLQAFYSQASAQSKAELQPLLEELQRSMQSGRALRW